MIYFLRLNNGLIKIGTTKNLRSRMAQHRSSYKDHEVLTIMEGGREEERALHARFSHLRIAKNLELFSAGDDLVEFIGSLPDVDVNRLISKMATEVGHVNWLISKDVRRMVKSAAALEGITMDKYVEQVFLEHFQSEGLLSRKSTTSPPRKSHATGSHTH
jgi:hypothetical protein